MAFSVTIEQAQANLREFIRQLAPGEEIIMTKEQRPVAQLRLRGGTAEATGPGFRQGQCPVHVARLR